MNIVRSLLEEVKFWLDLLGKIIESSIDWYLEKLGFFGVILPLLIGLVVLVIIPTILLLVKYR